MNKRVINIFTIFLNLLEEAMALIGSETNENSLVLQGLRLGYRPENQDGICNFE